MKKISFLFVSIMAISLIWSCTSPASQNQNTAGVNTDNLKGQSGVVDDQSQPNILQVALVLKITLLYVPEWLQQGFKMYSQMQDL